MELIQLDKVLDEGREDFFGDILPEVAKLAAFAKQQEISPAMPAIVGPEVIEILFKGFRVVILRHYNIETNRFSAHLILWGWKAEGAEIGSGAGAENVQRT